MTFNMVKNKVCHKLLFKHINYTSLFCLILILILNNDTNVQAPQKKVVMISIDGTPDYFIDKF